MTIPAPVSEMGADVFLECAALRGIVLERSSYAAQHCEEHGMPYACSNANGWLK